MANHRTIKRIRKVAIIASMTLAAIIVLFGLAGAIGAAWLASDGGRAWLVAEIAAQNRAGGLPFRVSAIRGNPFTELEASDLVVTDDNGDWLTAPNVRLSWRPMALLSGRVDIAGLTAHEITWQRRPSYAGGDSGEQASSGWIDSYALETADLIARVEWLEGAPEIVFAASGGYNKEGSADLHINLLSQGGAGDAATVDLTWAADTRRFDVSLALVGAPDGIIAGIAGLGGQGELQIDAEGSGPIDAWNGEITASIGEDYSLSATAKAEGEDAATISGNIQYATFADPILSQILGGAADITGRISAAGDGRTAVDLQVAPAAGRLNLGFILDRAGRIENRRLAIEAALTPMEWPGVAEPAPATGDARFSGELTGTSQRFSLAGALNVADVTSGIANGADLAAQLQLDRDGEDWRWQVAAAGRNLAWQGGLASLPESAEFSALTSGEYRRGSGLGAVDVAEFDFGWASGSGSFAPGGSDRPSSVVLNARLRLPDLLGPDAALSAGLANISLNAARDGGSRPWSGDLAVRGTNFAFTDEAISQFVGDEPQLDVSFASSDLERFDISRGRLEAHGGSVTFSGPVGRDEMALGYEASLASLAGLLPENLSFDGALDVAGLLGGTPTEPRITGAFTVNRVDIERLLLTDVATAFTFVAPFDRWTATLNASGNSQYGPVSAALSGVRGEGGEIALADINLIVSTLNLTGDLTRAADGSWQGALRGELRQDDTPGVTPLIRGSGEFSLGLHPAGEDARLLIDANLVGLEFVTPGGTLVDIGALSGRLAAQTRAPFLAPGTDLEIRDLSYRNLHLDEAQLTSDEATAGQGEIHVAGSYLEAFNAELRFQRMAPVEAGDSYDITIEGDFAGHPIATGADPLSLTVGPTFLRADAPQLTIGEGRLGATFTRQAAAISASVDIADLDLAIFPATQLANFRGGRLSGTGELSLGEASEAATWNFTIADVAPIDALDENEASFRFQSSGNAADRDVRLNAGIFYGEDRTGALTAEFSYLKVDDGSYQIAADAPVAASLDWAGDIAPLWAFARLPDHALEGRLEGGLQVSGTLDAPVFAGGAALLDGAYSYYPSGLRLTDVRAEISGRGDRLSITDLSGRDSGGGRLTASGNVRISPELTFPGTVRIEADHLQLLRRDDIRGTVSADLTYERGAGSASLSGEMTTHQIDAELVSRLPHSVVDIDYRDLDAAPADAELSVAGVRPGRTRAELNIEGSLPGQVFVRGRGLDTEWQGRLQLRGTTAEPRLSGELTLRRGTFDLVGKRFDIREGRLTFLGERRIDPEINILAEATTPNIRAQVLITGRISAPAIEISSTPPLPEDEVIARLLFGTSVTELSAFQVAEVAAAISTLRGDNSLDIMGRARRSLGLDTFYVAPTGDGESGFTVTGGKYLRRNVFVEVQQKTAVSDRETRIRIDYASRFRAESTFGPERGNGLKLKLFWDY